MNYISLNIKYLIEREQLSQDAFGQLFDLKRGAIGSYINEIASPKIETLQKISAKYGIRIDDIINRDISVLEKDYDDFGGKTPKTVDQYRGVPYWNLSVSAGRSLVDVIGKAKPDGYISGLPGADIAENILPVTGTSMEPEITSGAIIGVRLMNNWDTLNTERIYLIITHDDRMIKRIEHDEKDAAILWCISPNYPKFKIYKEEIIEIQRVCFVYNPK